MSLHEKLVTIHYTSLDEFCSSISDDYKFKKEILEACKHIKYKLSYTAPEIVNNVFCNYIEIMIAKHLPTENNEWAKKSWEILTKSTLVVHELIIKEYKN